MSTRARRTGDGTQLRAGAGGAARDNEPAGERDAALRPWSGVAHSLGSAMCVAALVSLGVIFAITIHDAVAGTAPPAQGFGAGAMRGTTRTVVVGRVSPDDRVVMPLPYGSDLEFSDEQVRRAVRLGLAGDGGGERATVPAAGAGEPGGVRVPPEYRGLTAAGIRRVVGGGVINAVYDVTLSNGARVFVKLGSPFWRGCAKSVGEAAVQQYVASHTRVPTPRVLAAQRARWVLASDGVTPVYDVLAADLRGTAVALSLPDFIIMEVAPGRKLQSELRKPQAEVPASTRREYMRQWVDVFRQLRAMKFPRYGSFGEGMEVGPLATNGGCSGLGPFATYSQYAAARVRMFLPLLEKGACAGSRFASMVPRLRCLADSFESYGRGHAAGFPGRVDELQPVLLHTDLSARNILVEDDAAGGGPRISAVLDWEFAVAGPAEEEFTFDATKEGLPPGDRVVLEELAQEVLGEVRADAGGATAGRQTRKDHVAAYWSLITFCHAHAWRDDAAFTDNEREAAYLREEMAMFKMLHRHGC